MWERGGPRSTVFPDFRNKVAEMPKKGVSPAMSPSCDNSMSATTGLFCANPPPVREFAPVEDFSVERLRQKAEEKSVGQKQKREERQRTGGR